jgi:putative transposase
LSYDRRAASTSNEIWAMDFVHDQLATGQKIRVLVVVDTFSRFSPVIDPRFSYQAETSWRPWNRSAPRLAVQR